MRVAPVSRSNVADLEIRIRKEERDGEAVYPVELSVDHDQRFEPGALDPALAAGLGSTKRAAKRGDELFRGLFMEPALLAAWQRLATSHPERRLRLTIDPGAPELHQLPWEALAEAPAGGGAAIRLAAAIATPFSRFLATDHPVPAPVADERTRLLVAVASPADWGGYDEMAAIDRAAETKALEAALAPVVAAGRLEIVQIAGPLTFEALTQAIVEHRPHFVHCVCHGRFNPPPEPSCLYLEDGDGRARAISEDELIAAWKRLGPALPRLVYLSSCETAKRAPADAFRGFGPRLVRDLGVAAVVAMQEQIEVDAARAFSASFYRGLLAHGEVDLAANQARNQLLLANLPDATWPVLFQRLEDGLLVAPPAGLAELDLAAYRAHLATELQGVAAGHVERVADEVVLAGGKLEKVPGAHAGLLATVLAHPRLVLLGAAGAGKSMALQFLATACLGETPALAERTPVVLELGRLHVGARGVCEEVLLELLAEALYQNRAAAGPPPVATVRNLLEQGPPLLVMLDGLNELAPESLEQSRKAIDGLARRYARHAWLATSRPHGFVPLAGWTTAELRPFDDAAVAEFLTREVGEEKAETLLAQVLGAGNSLLRLPLFLRFVVDRQHDLARLGKGLGSASSLVHDYVQRHLAPAPGSALATDHLEAALACIADLARIRLQVPLAAARGGLMRCRAGGLSDEAAGELLAELCRRGLLVERGGYLAFWHQTLLEYCLASRFVADWRGKAELVAGKAPVAIRMALSLPAAQPVLGFAVAHLRDEELEPALTAAVAANPSLATLWVDDLYLDDRAPAAREQYFAELRKLAWRARLKSRLGDWEAPKALGAAAYMGFGLSAFIGLGAALVSSILLLGGERGAALWGLVGLIVGSLSALVLVHTRRPSVSRLGDLLPGIVNLRSEVLRTRLKELAAAIRRSWLSSPDLREAAGLGLELASLGGLELAQALENSRDKAAMVLQLARVQSPHVVPLLAHLISYRNYLSLPALEGLAERSRRFPAERDEVKAVVERCWEDLETVGGGGNAELLLATLGAKPPKKRKWSARLAAMVSTGAFLLLNFAVQVSSWLWEEATRAIGSTQHAYTLFASVVAVVLFLEARARGARMRVPRLGIGTSRPVQLLAAWLALARGVGILAARFDAFDVGFSVLFVLAIVYFLVKGPLRRRAIPVDWRALRAALAA